VLSYSKALLLTPVAVLYIEAPASLLSDTAAVAFVAAFWLLSGFINSLSYVVIPQLVPAASAPRAASVMSLVFQLACVTGLGLATWLEYDWFERC